MDGSTKATVKSIGVFGNTVEPLDVAAVGDQSGDLVSELAVLGQYRSNGNIGVWVVDADLVRIRHGSSNIFFGPLLTPLGITRVEDLNGDARPEIGVTVVNKATNATTLRVKDESSWSILKDYTFAK
jgi:hypothetical protein